MGTTDPTLSQPGYTRIVTHDDFDGVVSAALCGLAEGIRVEHVRFSGPGSVLDPGLGVDADTIVCDLPHHPAAGLWFDHHVGNYEDYLLKGGNPDAVRETFAPEKSCARVVYRYYRTRERAFPAFMDRTVQEADTVDSFDYEGIQDWQRETPGKVLSDTLRIPFRARGERIRYMRRLVRWVQEAPLEEALSDRCVQEMYQVYKEKAERTRALIEQLARFHPEDPGHEIVLLDTTGLKHQPSLIKGLAFLSFPEAKAVLEVKSLFRQKRKTNDLGISMSLSPAFELEGSAKDVGEIMRSLNIGDGHRGAGAGRILCKSKAEMVKEKERILQKIYKMWRDQRAAQEPPREG